MIDFIQAIINGLFAGIGFFIAEEYVKPYIEKRRIKKELEKLRPNINKTEKLNKDNDKIQHNKQ